MAIEYTWVFNPLNVKLSEDGMTNVVYNVNWRMNAADGEYTATLYGSIGVPAPSPAAFTPYEDLTEAMVQEWVIEALGPEQVNNLQANLANQIELKKNPVEASLQPPWSNT